MDFFKIADSVAKRIGESEVVQANLRKGGFFNAITCVNNGDGWTVRARFANGIDGEMVCNPVEGPEFAAIAEDVRRVACLVDGLTPKAQTVKGIFRPGASASEDEMIAAFVQAFEAAAAVPVTVRLVATMRRGTPVAKV